MEVYRSIDEDEEGQPGGCGKNMIEYEFKPSSVSLSGLDGYFKLLSTLGSAGEEEIQSCDNEVNLQLPFEMKGDHFATSQLLNRNKQIVYHFRRDVIADTRRYVIQTATDDKNVALVRASRTFSSDLDMEYFQIPGDYHSIRNIEIKFRFFLQTSFICEGIHVIAVIKRESTGFNLFHPFEKLTIHINHTTDIRLVLLSIACIHSELLACKILLYFLVISAALCIYVSF